MSGAEIEHDRAEALPRVLSGRYRLDAKIGQGGMGVVYRGFDMAMRRPIAVKLIRAEATADDEAINRFLREAKNTARIQHEHIVKVFDLGRSDDGELYFVMEFLQGESLATRLRREGRLHPRLVGHIGAQVCEALDYAHRMGIIHRDLKPANLMLVRRGSDDAFVKVLDFGVAKSQDQHTQLTRTGMLVGTVEYMAPEQIIGRHVDARTDIYSLGVLLYRALAGTPPFKDTGVPALINAHINLRPDPLTKRAPNAGISRELDEVIQKCLAKRPEQRFATMGELARALRAAIEKPAADEDPFPSGQDTIVAHAGENAAGDADSTQVHGAKPAPDGVSVAFSLPGAPPDPLDATRQEGGPPKVCPACSKENPRFVSACRRCGKPFSPGSSPSQPNAARASRPQAGEAPAAIPPQEDPRRADPAEDFSDFIATNVIRTKVIPSRPPQPSQPGSFTPPPAAGMPPPGAPPRASAAPPALGSVPPPPPAVAYPSARPSHPSAAGHVAGAAPVPPPETWPPAHLRPPEYGGASGSTVRHRGGITWQRVVAYLFLLVLFTNMCAERFALGSVVLFLGGAFLVSLAWLIARAREGG